MYNNLSIRNSDYEINLEGLTSEEIYDVTEMIAAIINSNSFLDYLDIFEKRFSKYYNRYVREHLNDNYGFGEYEDPAHQYATYMILKQMLPSLKDEWIQDFESEAMINPDWASLYPKVFVHSHLRESRRLQSIFS